MPTKRYIEPRPEPGDDIRDLMPVDRDADALTPDRPVTCIHRGQHVITTQYDGVHYDIEPGKFRTLYKVALHIKTRAIVPGSRNSEPGRDGFFRTKSYIGIIGLDKPEDCEPFPVEQLEEQEAAGEGLDRETVDGPASRARKVSMREIRAKTSVTTNKPKARKGQFEAQRDNQATDEAAANAAAALEPPAMSDAERDEIDQRLSRD